MPGNFRITMEHELSQPSEVWSTLRVVSSRISRLHSNLGYWDGEAWSLRLNGQRSRHATLKDVKKLVEGSSPSNFAVSWDHADEDITGGFRWSIMAAVREKNTSWMQIVVQGTDKGNVEEAARYLVYNMFNSGIRVQVHEVEAFGPNGVGESLIDETAKSTSAGFNFRRVFSAARISLAEHLVGYAWGVLTGITVIVLTIWWRPQ